MDLRLRFIQISFALHIAIFFIAVNAGNSIVPANKPLIIDFRLEDAIPKNNNRNAAVKMPKSKTTEQKLKVKNPESQETPEVMPAASPMHSAHMEHNQEVIKPKEIVNVSHVLTENKDTIKKGSSIKNNIETAAHSSENHDRAGMYLKQNLSYIRDVIQKKIIYPRAARQMGWGGKVVISFIVCNDGFVKDIKITESSGFEILDKNAVEAIKKASPFPKPSAEALIIMPIKYSLN